MILAYAMLGGLSLGEVVGGVEMSAAMFNIAWPPAAVE